MSDEQFPCEECGTMNSVRAIFCTHCGFNVRDTLSSLESESQTRFVGEPADFTRPSLVRRTNRAYFGLRATLILNFFEAGEELRFANLKQSFTLGRTPDEPQPSKEQHIDLSQFNAAIKDLGVSRKHARIARINATVVLEDLGALNGTYVNRERISPVNPCVLCDGDEVRLGNFPFKIIFEKG